MHTRTAAIYASCCGISMSLLIIVSPSVCVCEIAKRRLIKKWLMVWRVLHRVMDARGKLVYVIACSVESWKTSLATERYLSVPTSVYDACQKKVGRERNKRTSSSRR